MGSLTLNSTFLHKYCRIHSILLLVSLLCQHCSPSEGTYTSTSAELITSEGIYYKYLVHDPNRRKPTSGDLISFQLKVENESDSVLSEQSFHEYPYQRPYFIAKKYFNAIFSEANEGDSLFFWIPADSLSQLSGYVNSPLISPGSQIKYTLKIHKIENKDEIRKRILETLKAQKEIDKQNIKTYCQKLQNDDSSSVFQFTESGIAYQFSQIGKGPKPQLGDTVGIQYTSKLLNGQVFESSDGANEFIIGEMLPGLNQGIPLMYEGSKGTFILPSELGYGINGIEGIVPPNSILVFDIHLVRVK